MRNRFIGDNSRLTYDLIQHLKESGASALFLSLDIQDAFNSVNCDFTRLVLKHRNFPDSMTKWFNTLYVGSISRIVYNGHISDSFSLQRSCRQGDPLSPYIFLLVMGILLENIKRNESIKGVKVGSLHFKVSAYADNTLCYLDGSVNSCRALFDELGVFAKLSGLSPNIGKTQAFWAGKNTTTRCAICPKINMTWVKKLKVLGIYFANNDAETFGDNFEDNLSKITKVIAGWKQRYLTIAGKIIITKTLLLPMLTHVFTALPRPPDRFIKTLRSQLFKFIWGGKVDRVKRSSLYYPVDEGGLSMIDIDVQGGPKRV